MSIQVSDVRSSPKDQIVHAATVLGRSPRRRQVFLAICRGKRRVKTVTEIVRLTGLDRIAVLQEAGVLANNDVIEKVKIAKELAYRRYPFFAQNKRKILSLAADKGKLESYPTKATPRIRISAIKVDFPRKMVDVKQVTIDDIDSFARVGREGAQAHTSLLYEKDFKEGLKKILGEQGTFADWGGETDDLFSTRLRMNGKRLNVAFGLKGIGTSGILTPRKMGKRGDQIQRLFRSPSDVFLIQYWSQIDESVIEQMRHIAIAKSVLEGRRIYFGVVDGQDTSRLVAAYQDCFLGIP